MDVYDSTPPLSSSPSDRSTPDSDTRSFLDTPPRPLPPVPTTLKPARGPRPLPVPLPFDLYPRRLTVLAPRSHTLPALLRTPRILASVLPHLAWPDIRALGLASPVLARALLQPRTPAHDALLARLVPGYRYCLHHADLRAYYDSYDARPVDLDFRDLDLFLESQNVPLHSYPLHALAFLSEASPSRHHDAQTARLAALALAHSRIVLLLQSLIHSSSIPQPPTPSPSTITLTPTPLPALVRPRPRSRPLIRELVFPAPLSFSLPPSDSVLGSTPPGTTKHVGQRRASYGFSLLGKPKVPPPPPSADPFALRVYADSWRGARRRAAAASSTYDSLPPSAFVAPRTTSHHRPKSAHKAMSLSLSSMSAFSMASSLAASGSASASESASGAGSAPTSDDEGAFRRAHRRAATSIHTYSYSHSRASSLVHAVPPLPPLPPLPALLAAPSSTSAYTRPHPDPHDPHDLLHATSRARSPVLRVFVPCAALDAPALAACAAQLRAAGLWEHLSAGDVVCNVGYIPPAPRAASAPSSSPSSSAESVWGYPTDTPDALPSPWERARVADQDQDVRGARRAWLVFTGTALVPHAPPAPPPVPDARALPSPLYYVHLATAPGARPAFARLRLPVPRARLAAREALGTSEFGSAHAGTDAGADVDGDLESLLALVRLPTRVRSPHSPSGVALAKRYVWLARLPGPRRPALAPAPAPAPASTPAPSSGSAHSHPRLAALSMPPFPRAHTEHGDGDGGPDEESDDADVWAGVGEGWRKEWVLQAEGTVEGRTALLDALRDSAGAEWAARDEAAGRVWELVGERAAAGCVWLRLLTPASASQQRR